MGAQLQQRQVVEVVERQALMVRAALGVQILLLQEQQAVEVVVVTAAVMVQALLQQVEQQVLVQVQVEMVALILLAVLLAVRGHQFILAVAEAVLVMELQGLLAEQAAYMAVVAVEVGLLQTR